MTTQAVALVEVEPDAGPPFYVEPAPSYSLTVPLLLAAGWGALFTFSVVFLMDDGRIDRAAAAAEHAVIAEAAAEPVRRVAALVETEHDAPRVETAAVEDRREPEPVRNAALSEPVAPRPQEPSLAADRPDFVGIWGPNVRACGARASRRGFIPATITEDSAKAGRTFCRFRNGRREGPAFTASADCSDGGRRWTSQVRLVVNGDRLNWTSEKGPSVYVRCGRRDG